MLSILKFFWKYKPIAVFLGLLFLILVPIFFSESKKEDVNQKGLNDGVVHKFHSVKDFKTY